MGPKNPETPSTALIDPLLTENLDTAGPWCEWTVESTYITLSFKFTSKTASCPTNADEFYLLAHGVLEITSVSIIRRIRGQPRPYLTIRLLGAHLT